MRRPRAIALALALGAIAGSAQFLFDPVNGYWPAYTGNGQIADQTLTACQCRAAKG
jgi:hypothetical protein